MKFLGTGSALPKKVVSNDDLAQVMDTSDEWIRSRTGIGMRHIAVEETTTSMAVEAAEKALADAKISGCEIDLIIAGTISPDYIFPSLACEVQAAIGAKSATAFDLSAGCSGFLFALATADAYFRTGRYKHALVIGAETLSKMMNWADRSTCVLFGDGAGAAVVSAEGSQLLSMVQGSDGAGGMALHCENRPVNNLYRQLGAQHYAFTQMDGREVYKFAVRTVPKAVSEALEQAELPIEDVKYFLLHQANIRIIESVAKRLHQPMEKFPCNLQKCGNVSAASVPILLDNVHKHGMISGGDKIVLAGFGAGLPQTPDMHIDGPGATVVVVPPHLLQKLGAGEHAARVLHQVLKQFEFLVCQIDRMTVQGSGVTVRVHNKIAGADLTVDGSGVAVHGGKRVRRRITTFGHKSQSPFDLSRRSGGNHHVRDTPLRIDHGEPALGKHQHNRRG